MAQVFLGLGTNLGERPHNLEQAIAGLSEVVNVTAVSPVYETEPWGLPDQPTFLNACLSGETELPPQNLLTFIKNLETEMGRTNTTKWGPRLIDIDILLYNNTVLEMNGLTIPHPHLHERAFVLAPLADIAADVMHPVLRQTIGALVTAVNLSTVHRLPNALFFSPKSEPPLKK
jgi:2-amino-4-hydroxy-6-hydroxymethyldihydropteridine diphosphokinase